MPDLPTLTVTQAQADRALAAFGSIAAYKKWLNLQVIAAVKEAELAQLRRDHQAAFAAASVAIDAAMPPP